MAMTVWLVGQDALPGLLKAGADPQWMHGAYTLQRSASVTADVANVPVYNFKSLAACEATPPSGFA
jgi:hypothetical protein